MTESLRSTFDQRRYRLAQVVVVFGSLATGMLLLTRLYEIFREDFLLYYGVTGGEYEALRADVDGMVPLTLGQLVVAAAAFVAVIWFVTSERRRVRESTQLDEACRCRSAHLVVERPSLTTLFDQVVTRTSAFAGLLLAGWLLQTSLERRLVGLGWGIEYSDWRSLLPLASVFGLSVLVGIIVACVSLVGIRAISVLELVLTRIGTRARTRGRRPRARRRPEHVARTLRELIGCDILSRPPPTGRANALAFAR